MDHSLRTIRTSNFFEKCIDIQMIKGKEYTTEGDAYKDVMDEAAAMDITPA